MLASRGIVSKVTAVVWERRSKVNKETFIVFDNHAASSWNGGGDSLIHVFVWGRETVGAFSFLSTPCPWLCSELALLSTSSPHRCVPRHRDDTQHVPRLEGEREVITCASARLPHPLFRGFLISASCVSCQLMHNVGTLSEHAAAGWSSGGEGCDRYRRVGRIPWDLWQVNS